MNSELLRKFVKGAIISLVVALLTYMESTIPGMELGKWTPLVVSGNSVLVNFVREYLKANGYQI